MRNMRLLILLFALPSLLFINGCTDETDEKPPTTAVEPAPIDGEEEPLLGTTPPVAKPACDISAILYSGDTIHCHGWRSNDDIDDDPIVSYKWSIRNRPTGSSVIISMPTESETTVTFDMPGDYLLELTVQDPTQMSSPATVAVEVHPSRAFFSYNMNSAYSYDYSCIFSYNLRLDEGGPYVESSSSFGTAGDYVFYIGQNVSALAYSPMHNILYANSKAEKGITIINLDDGNNFLQPEGYRLATDEENEPYVDNFYDLRIVPGENSSIADLVVYGNKLLLADSAQDQILVYDLGDDGLYPAPISSISVCNQPIKMEIDQGKIYMLCSNGGAEGIINLIDAETLMVINEIDLGEDSEGTIDIAIGGGKIFITHHSNRKISVLDLQTLNIITQISIGTVLINSFSVHIYPYKLDYAKGKIYVGHYLGNASASQTPSLVYVIDANTYEYIKYIYTGNATFDRTLEVKSDGYTNVYVGSDTYKGFTPIDLATNSYISGTQIWTPSLGIPNLVFDYCDEESVYVAFSSCGAILMQ
jgi:K319L-like, PKD domain